MKFDFKKEYKEWYLPPQKPQIIDLPQMNFLAVRGKGNPNLKDGDYQKAIQLLYTVAYTIKMSKMGIHKIDGYIDYVVPPLEGLWWQDSVSEIDWKQKESFQWISLIRIPDFVKKSDFNWAIEQASQKKHLDCSKVEFFTYTEGLCVQCMHIGPYDEEAATVDVMNQWIRENGFESDFSENRYHHEIYLSDARKTNPSKLKTVIRHPIRKIL